MNQAPAVRAVRGVLTACLVVLTSAKLLGLIDWSWWVVTAPFWVPFVIAVVVVIVAFGRGLPSER